MIPKLVMFDLDGTLAESKEPIAETMGALIARLLRLTDVAVISGGALAQFLKQVAARLPVEADLTRLYFLPTSGAALYAYRNDAWQKVYEERLSEKDKDTIETAILAAIKETRVVDLAAPSWGERIEYRGSQVTFSALGQEAPIEKKKAWDPSREKRALLREAIAKRLRGFSVAIGGSTSIDITRESIDKAYGVHKLCERLHIKAHDALYVGDELGAGGNDEAVYKTDIRTRRVGDPADTAKLIKELISH